MSPPRSKLERDNPPPRRKSCQACVRAKRRCDQRSPACLRCAQRKIQCQYLARPGLSQNIRSDPVAAQSQSRAPSQSQAQAQAQAPLTVGLTTPFQPEEMQSRGAGQDGMLFDAIDMAHTLQFFESPWPDDDNLQFDDMALGTAEGPLLTSRCADTSLDSGSWMQDDGHGAHEHNDMEYVFDFAEAGAPSMTTDIATRPPLGFSAPRRLDVSALANELENRFSYAISKIKAAPRTMLLDIEAPWCHPLLYKERMPRVMQGKSKFRWVPSSFVLLKKISFSPVSLEADRYWEEIHKLTLRYRCHFVLCPLHG